MLDMPAPFLIADRGAVAVPGGAELRQAFLVRLALAVLATPRLGQATVIDP